MENFGQGRTQAVFSGGSFGEITPLFYPVRATDSPKANKNVDTGSLGHKKTSLVVKGNSI